MGCCINSPRLSVPLTALPRARFLDGERDERSDLHHPLPSHKQVKQQHNDCGHEERQANRGAKHDENNNCPKNTRSHDPVLLFLINTSLTEY